LECGTFSLINVFHFSRQLRIPTCGGAPSVDRLWVCIVCGKVRVTGCAHQPRAQAGKVNRRPPRDGGFADEARRQLRAATEWNGSSSGWLPPGNVSSDNDNQNHKREMQRFNNRYMLSRGLGQDFDQSRGYGRSAHWGSTQRGDILCLSTMREKMSGNCAVSARDPPSLSSSP